MRESTEVCVISIDPSGDTEERRPLEALCEFDWTARRRVVLVEGDMVLTYDELVARVHGSAQAIPEVILFAPLAGGA